MGHGLPSVQWAIPADSAGYLSRWNIPGNEFRLLRTMRVAVLLPYGSGRPKTVRLIAPRHLNIRSIVLATFPFANGCREQDQTKGPG